MNAALYLFNALAMVAVVSFHFLAGTSTAQVHINVKDWVQRPVAQRAGMHEQGKAPAIMANAPAARDLSQGAEGPPDRYTF
jgi:hypothetical protein